MLFVAPHVLLNFLTCRHTVKELKEHAKKEKITIPGSDTHTRTHHSVAHVTAEATKKADMVEKIMAAK